MTVTLHSQGDIEHFLVLNELLENMGWEKSLRLYIFKDEIDLDTSNFHLWEVKNDLVWKKSVPLRDGEYIKKISEA